MTTRHTTRLLHRVALAAITVVAAAFWFGCDQAVSLSNVPGHVSFIGPMQADADGNVVTWFGVSDPEGDFVSAQVEVCPDGGACFVPSLQPGGVVSETLENLPAVEEGRSPALKLIWAPECGPNALTGADASFTVRISVLASNIEPELQSLESEPTTLAELGRSCPADGG